MAEAHPAADPPEAQAGDGSAAAASPGTDAAVAAAETRAQAAIRDAQLRAAAEVDNIRKRAQRDVENAQRFALERFAGELLAVRDSLELAVANGAQADTASLVAGQQATLRLLQKAFDRFAIQQISPRGGPFDPSLHEAVLSQPSSTVPGGHVIEVLQSGYQLNGRLLRPARVIVAAGDAAAT